MKAPLDAHAECGLSQGGFGHFICDLPKGHAGMHSAFLGVIDPTFALLDARTTHLLDAIRVASKPRTPAKNARADQNAVAALFAVLELI